MVVAREEEEKKEEKEEEEAMKGITKAVGGGDKTLKIRRFQNYRGMSGFRGEPSDFACS